MSKGKAVAVLLVLAMVFGSVVFAAGTQQAGQEKFVLKFSCLENETHAQGVGLITFKAKIEELSGGQITVQNYFSGSLFTQDGATPALISGQLELNYVSTQHTSEYLPEVAMFASTYMFKDYNHARTTFDSQVGKDLYKRISDNVNYVPLTAYYNGSRQLNLRTRNPVVKPEDLRGIVLRMPNSATWIAAGESLGAKVTPLAYGEVYTALQTGTIDAQDNPMLATRTMKFYEVTNQISLTYHLIDFGFICVNKDVFNRMSAQQQDWMYQAAIAAQQAVDATQLKAESELIDFFKSQGLLITNPDIEAFRKNSYNYYIAKGMTKNWNLELYNKIQALAK